MAPKPNFLRIVGAAAFCLFSATPAFAGAVTVPAPLLGAGLPALAAFGVGYWALRARRGR